MDRMDKKMSNKRRYSIIKKRTKMIEKLMKKVKKKGTRKQIKKKQNKR